MVGATAVVVALLFAAAALWPNASRREIVGALVGGVLAGAVNAATDAAAARAGFWRYTEVTTPYGPLLYYVVAGYGCAALALIMRWLRRRGGSGLGFLAFWALYAPIRDCGVAKTTGLIEFNYDPWPLVVVADSLSSILVPLLVAYGCIVAFAGRLKK
jgi:hypothetical protein